MSYSIPDASNATRTKLRSPRNISPFSGMCSVCSEGCIGTCEIGCSAVRGAEFISPITNDKTQTASEKDYPVDFSHFNINGSLSSTVNKQNKCDKLILSNVNTEIEIGAGGKIKLKAPFIFSALAKLNWKDYHTGAALAGVLTVIGEDAILKDPKAEIKNGRIIKFPQLKERIRAFKDYFNGYGEILLQANVDDNKLGLLEYATNELGLEAVELKLGQGSKGIQGMETFSCINKAIDFKKKGYLVYPDPENPVVSSNHKKGIGSMFMRINRLPIWDEEVLFKKVQKLRNQGVKFISLKMGAFRPVDQAKVIKFASEYGIDLITVDGAGGGTGWSPWKMMNEWGMPTVYLESLLYEILHMLHEKKVKYIPSMAIAGGFTLEDQIFKGLALGAPYINLIGLCRAPMAAAMVGRTVGNLINENKIPKIFRQYGNSIEQIFADNAELSQIYGDRMKEISSGAIGVYNYTQRVLFGLRQFVILCRKLSLSEISREDIFTLTREASSVTGIKHALDVDRERIKELLK